MTYLRLPPPPSSPPPPLLPPPWPPSDESVAVVVGYFSAARLFGRCNAVHRFSHANHSGRNEPSSSSSWRPSSWSFGPSDDDTKIKDSTRAGRRFDDYSKSIRTHATPATTLGTALSTVRWRAIRRNVFISYLKPSVQIPQISIRP